MKKIILLMLLLCALVCVGCDSLVKDEPKNTPAATEQVKNISFIIYRADASGNDKLLPEKITMKDNGKSLPENALEALVSTKPQDARMEDVIPVGTKVRSLKISADGTAVADFSKELSKRGQGSYGEMMLTYAIVNTLTEFPEIKRVQILVEGKPVTSISGHMDLTEPLTRNETLL